MLSSQMLWPSSWSCWVGFIAVCSLASWTVTRPLVAPPRRLVPHGGRGLFQVATELVAHGRQQSIGPVVLAPGREPLEQGRAQDGGGYRFVDRGRDRPAPLAGIGDPSPELVQVRALAQRGRGKVQQPRGDDTAATPELGDVRDVK